MAKNIEPPLIIDTPIEVPPPPNYLPRETSGGDWAPNLNPTQQLIFDELAEHILACGEKGSGKTSACLHALIRHCYEEEDALALVIAPQLRSGNKGVIYDLMWALDVWQNGNWKDFNSGERADAGMGLEFTEASLDPQTKDRVLYIGNMHGGWSTVMLVSIPYAAVVEKRMKSMSPSFVYVDEITELDGAEFFTDVTAQLGRRRGIRGNQPYYSSCNPEGPSHWVYKIFFVDFVNQETGERDPNYLVFHVPFNENAHNLPPGYIDKLKKNLKSDATKYARLIEGRWIDRPSGQAIFLDHWEPMAHIRPTPGTEEHRRGWGLNPKPGYPIVLGWDPGTANFSIHFLQMIPILDGTLIWIVFEEINRIGMASPHHVVVPKVLERMDYWKEKLGPQTTFTHIADNSAFSNLRTDGSFDNRKIQELSKGRIRLRAAIPKGTSTKETVPARVNCVREMLANNQLFVSARCPRTIEMFRLLESEKVPEGKHDPERGNRPQRSAYLHPFDSLSYPLFFHMLVPSAFVMQIEKVESSVFRAGRG